VRIGTAIPAKEYPCGPWKQFGTRCVGSATTRSWKQQIADALVAAGVTQEAPGPLAMHMAWRVSARRNWMNLWKPTGDALGPILGVPHPGHPFSPNDDRITELELHLTKARDIGNEVDVGIWWRRPGAEDRASIPAAAVI
jgi:hypothetical protein